MLKLEHRFAIEILTPQGTSLGQFELPIDWEPARASVHLLQLKQGLSGTISDEGTIRVEPLWDAAGEPYATGARLTTGDVISEVEKNYFKTLAVEASTSLVEKKVLKSGDLYVFRVLGYREIPTVEAVAGSRFTVRDSTPPVRLKEQAFAELAATGIPVPCENENRDDIPVFVPQSVLDEVEALTLEAGSVETGGILIGHIYHDAAASDLAVVVTAQIPARHTQSQTTKLTFTAETWTAVQAALDLRRSGEQMVGWFHSHPSFAFCNPECPPERRATCALQKPFLSSDDLLLHRAVFPKAWQVALLCNNADAGIEHALFGWRRGLVQRRAYTVLGAPPLAEKRPVLLLNETTTGDTVHAQPCKK